jgi:hypothetical protein
VILSLLASVAAAAPPEYPADASRRPPTLPRNDVRVDANSTVGVDQEVPADFAGGFGVGVTDRFEIGAVVVPLELNPDIQYLDPSVYAAYAGEITDDFYLTPMARAFVPVTEQGLLDAQLGALWQPTDGVALSVAPTATLDFQEEGTAGVFSAPVAATFNPTRKFFVQLESGIGTDPFSWRYGVARDDGDNNLVVPLGASIGGTFGRPRNAMLDLSVGAFLPEFAQPDGLNTDNVLVTAAVTTFVLQDREDEQRPRPTRDRQFGRRDRDREHP